MQRQRSSLPSQCSFHQHESFSKILNHIFSDDNIYKDKQIRKLLKMNPKGFIHTNNLLQMPIVKRYFDDMGIVEKDHQVAFIQCVIEQKCHDLHYNLGRVRRKIPFNMDIFKKLKPICLQRFSSPTKMDQIKTYFDQDIKIFNRSPQDQSNKQQIEDDILIYCNDYRDKLQGIRSKKPPFNIINFEEYYREYQLAERMRKRKFNGIFKPLQMPKKRNDDMGDFQDRQIHRQSMEQENYGKFRKENRPHPRRNPQKAVEEYQAIAQLPNPSFNQLLLDMFKNTNQNQQEMKDESTMS